MEAIIWLGLVVVLIIIELGTLGLTTVWFAGGALVSCIAALLGAGVAVQVVLFLLVSVLLLVFTRPVAMRCLNQSRTKTNAESLIGREAVVTLEIDNLKSQGQVQVNGLEWTARASDSQETIAKDTIVEIEKIDGVKLIVKRKEG